MPKDQYPMYEKLKKMHGKSKAAAITNGAGKPVPPARPKKKASEKSY
jgi:hypothetical protein